MFKSTLVCVLTVFAFLLHAQSGCPGCAVQVPAGLPVDTVYLPPLPDGIAGTPYDEDISFRLPKTTTPVHALDSTTQPGLNISKFEIVSIQGLPPGMYWQPNKFNFNVSNNDTDGCIKICGTPSTSDSFELIVTLKATVFIVTQEATFPMSLYIAPKVNTTVGFSMSNPEGCGSTTVDFINNVPSGGQAGFTYEWNFGDGSPVFTGENPPSHTYDEPGTYPVSYHATVDTGAYILESVTVVSVSACVDELGLGTPDLFIQIFAPNNGPKIFDSSPDVNNTPLPYVFPVGIELNGGNYRLQVIDEDSGLKGSDDDCGSISFNFLSNGPLVAGGLKVILNIVHPIEQIQSNDTVIVYPQPIDPVLTAPNGQSTCPDESDLVLLSSYGSGNQWLLDSDVISGATDFIYIPVESGYYQAQIISQYGCVATSDSVHIEFFPLPTAPVWYNYNNSLRLFDTSALPAQYSLQWFNGPDPIPGETGFWYCSMSSGTFGLQVTDLESGCVNIYANLVENNPEFDCTVGTKDIENQLFDIIPNPASETALVRLKTNGSKGVVRLRDITGRLMTEQNIAAGQEQLQLELRHLPPGMFVVELISDQQRSSGRLLIER